MKTDLHRNGQPRGWVLIAILIVVIVVVTLIIVTQLVSCIHKNMGASIPNPTNQETNTIWSTYVITNEPIASAVFRGFQFDLQYGANEFGEPFMAAGQLLPVNAKPAQPEVITDGTAWTPDGGVTFTAYTAWGEVWSVTPAGAVQIGTWTPPNPAGQTVILERSEDLCNWAPIFTNQILPASVWNFTDDNGSFDHDFYRLEVQP